MVTTTKLDIGTVPTTVFTLIKFHMFPSNIQFFFDFVVDSFDPACFDQTVGMIVRAAHKMTSVLQYN